MLLATSTVHAFFLVAATALVTCVVLFLIAFGFSRALKRISVIDVFWGLSFVLSAVTTLLVARAQHVGLHWVQFLVLGMVAIWGLRLSIYLVIRQRGQGEDRRYELIMRRAKGKNPVVYTLVVIFGFQALLSFLVSLPIQAAMVAPSVATAVVVAGVVVWLIGEFFEAVGDAQLRRFASDPANKGKVMDRGLWSWTRHPNYFGDSAVWWGIFLVAASSGWGALSIVGPIIMTMLLTRVSGKPLLERDLSRRKEGWDAYVARTSSFFPRPPRRGTSGAR